jgi:hypothetical protein
MLPLLGQRAITHYSAKCAYGGLFVFLKVDDANPSAMMREACLLLCFSHEKENGMHLLKQAEHYYWTASIPEVYQDLTALEYNIFLVSWERLT